jgi:cytochrome c biogenesis protein CcdA
VIPETGIFANYVFKGFGIFAIVLGVLNLRDYIKYKPGGFMTEMPIKMRPGLRRLVKNITSPKGAFIVGLFVTIFLLPCTIGPYVIASGQLANSNSLNVIPWLLLYNAIFILPMVAITLIIYFGVTTVEKVSGWKDRNIRKLHLVEGLILTILGILMFTGLI